ncbi:hypothetical protein GF345_00385 [Candidatus Woesearchaeota archaeon]|nr:hypothetical protein [Candidatus Woesearchaeota archaeon]
MKLEINIEKKYAWLLVAMAVMVSAGIFAIAQTSPSSLGVWHTLQSISKDSSGAVSVDADGNGVIDSAEGWRLLARGSDYTEEARITLDSTGVDFTTDAQERFNTQEVNVFGFEWPVYAPREILFVVENPLENGFCVGGTGILDLEGDGGWDYTACTDYRYNGNTLIATEKTDQRNWIRLNINGVAMENCPDILNNRMAEAPASGTWGRRHNGVSCLYTKGTSDGWNNDLTSLTIEEYDHSDDYGAWKWEIWYR